LLLQEEDARAHAQAIEAAPNRSIAAPSLVEACVVAQRRGLQGIEAVLAEAGLEVVAFTAEHAAAAIAAHRRYGPGSGSRARLNLGDCMAYAVAKVLDQPLLFKGDDFTHTDIEPALKG
jgi:ribonuclease VapC